MWRLFALFPLIQIILAQSTAINVADVPQCAKDCLSNSTLAAKSCTSLDVKCLCNTPEFVSTFYCCLSQKCNTSEQATAITFNQQQCAAVNATAPDFVGCSPLRATSSAGGSKTATTVTPANGAPISTISTLISAIASYSATSQVTAAFDGRAILTGSCTVPLFALVSATIGAELFPQVGCASNRQDCCPFDNNINGVITKCPSDYFTTANGCCPSGYQVYSTAFGAETPCYSMATTILIPATTPSISALSVITNTVFSRKYTLAANQSNGLAPGAIAGIAVVTVAFLAITVGVSWWIRRRNKTQVVEQEKSGATFPLEEPVLPPQQDTTSPQELASPDFVGFQSPNSDSAWPISELASPPVYEGDKPLPMAKAIAPSELPGSTFMNEHHPAYATSDSLSELSGSDVEPRTPVRSPVLSASDSPAITPLPDNREGTASPGIISPLSSTRMTRTATEHSMVSDKD